MKMFGAISFVIITKEALYKTNSLACFFQKGHAGGRNLTRKSSAGIFCNNHKDYYNRNIFEELFCNNFGQEVQSSRFLSRAQNSQANFALKKVRKDKKRQTHF